MPDLQNWIRLYSSSNRTVRVRAANGLLGRADEVPLEILIDILLHYSHDGLGSKVEKVLLNRSDPDLVNTVIKLLDSQNDFARQVACKILGQSADKTTAAHLLRMVGDADVMVSREAVLGLSKVIDRKELEKVKELYDRHRTDESSVVMAFRRALKNLEELK